MDDPMTPKEQHQAWKSSSPRGSGGHLTSYCTRVVSRGVRVGVFLALFSSRRQEAMFLTQVGLAEGHATREH